jgi:N-acetylmuramoyl-L-alanine amidase
MKLSRKPAGTKDGDDYLCGWRAKLKWVMRFSRLAAPFAFSLLLVPVLFTGCATPPRIGSIAPRTGDEIVAAGKYIHTGTRVVLWTDPGGYDAYRVERRFCPLDEADWKTSHQKVKSLKYPNRYSLRTDGLTAEEIERVRGGGWDLPTLQRVVDQFVIHYDECGTSRQCFKVLQDHRDLSVHFLLDLNGTIYQTLDLKERAWHATTSNNRSIGIEIANVGAYSSPTNSHLADWYHKDADGRTRITIPEDFGVTGIRTPNFVGRPARNEPINGVIQGRNLWQYDFTPKQYRALAHLVAAICITFPKIKCDYPRDAEGRLITHKLPAPALEKYEGLLGHYHVQTDKIDPGPAFNWDYVVTKARRLMRGGARAVPAGPAYGNVTMHRVSLTP